MDACAQGADPAFVTLADADRPGVLAARGITDLLRPTPGPALDYTSQNTVV